LAALLLWPCAAATWAAPASGAVATAAQPVLDHIRQTGTITLAHRESSVPFSYLDGQGQPVGYAVDLCLKLVAAVREQTRLKRLNVQWLKVSGADRLAKIEQHAADIECGSTTNNAERRTKVAFTVPHYITGARFLVPADSKVEKLADFEGLRLVSTKGTTPLKALTAANNDRMLRIKVLEAPDHAAAVQMVEKREADGFVMDDVLLFGLRSNMASPEAYKVVGKMLTIEALAMMLPKDDPAFKAIIDAEMKRLIRSGEAQAIYQRWFLAPIPPRGQVLNLPMNYLLRDFWKVPTDKLAD
jgi:glutamate/aspartate transport system substrate-binding protein